MIFAHRVNIFMLLYRVKSVLRSDNPNVYIAKLNFKWSRGQNAIETNNAILFKSIRVKLKLDQ